MLGVFFLLGKGGSASVWRVKVLHASVSQDLLNEFVTGPCFLYNFLPMNEVI